MQEAARNPRRELSTLHRHDREPRPECVSSGRVRIVVECIDDEICVTVPREVKFRATTLREDNPTRVDTTQFGGARQVFLGPSVGAQQPKDRIVDTCQKSHPDFELGSRDLVALVEAAEHEAADSLLAELANGAEATASLPDQPTWARVYDEVRRDNPGLFNALNLATLQLGRPSPLEAPESCSEYRDTLDYIAGWRAWYREIDRAGKFCATPTPPRTKQVPRPVNPCAPDARTITTIGMRMA